MNRRHVIVALTLVVVGLSPGGVAQEAPRVVAIGDVHGDGDAFAGILEAAGLVDAGRHWAGGRTRFVQTGDVFDRGPKVRDALDLLMRLEPEAEKAGGRVDALLGNHECMNLIREFRDVSPAAFASFATPQSEQRRQRAFDDYTKLMAARKKRLGKLPGPQPQPRDEWMTAHPAGFFEYVDALAPKGAYGKWLRGHKVVVQIGDTIFMHAGIDPSVAPATLEAIDTRAARDIKVWDDATDAAAKAGVILPFFTLQESLEAMQAEVRRIAAALKAQEDPGAEVTREYVDRLQAALTIGDSSLLVANGPLWFRGFATWTDQDRPQVDALLAKYRAARFVTGHNVMPTFRITPRFDGRIVLIDTGMLSSFFKGRGSAFELADGKATAIYTDSRDPLKH